MHQVQLFRPNSCSRKTKDNQICEIYYSLTAYILLSIEAQLSPISVVVRQLLATLGAHRSPELTPPVSEKYTAIYRKCKQFICIPHKE